MMAAKPNRAERRKKRLARLTPRERFDADVAANLDRPHNRDSRYFKATRNCPSGTWSDAVWNGDRHDLIDGTTTYSLVEFPPGMDRTLMVRCAECGRYTPPQNVVMELLCDDCARGRETVGVNISEALIEGVARRTAVYATFRQHGLTDRQIAVLSVWHEGHSMRSVAGFFGRNVKTIHETIVSAKRKLTEAGLQLPPRTREPKAGRPRAVDPSKLEAMAKRKLC